MKEEVSMKQKIKKAIISMVLAFSLTAQPFCTFSMNVFAGTDTAGSNDAPAKRIVAEAAIGSAIDTSYNVDGINESFSFAGNGTKVLDGSTVKNPGIVYAKKGSGDEQQTVYIIADINGILGKVKYAAELDHSALSAHNNVTNYAV